MKDKPKCQITSFIHCGKCLKEIPDGISPQEWGQIEVGFTKPGFQVWCKRHDCNVANFDFMGNKIDVIPG